MNLAEYLPVQYLFEASPISSPLANLSPGLLDAELGRVPLELRDLIRHSAGSADYFVLMNEIDRLETAIKAAGRIRRDDWIGQAKARHLQKYQEQL